jgi:hypothetical protein
MLLLCTTTANQRDIVDLVQTVNSTRGGAAGALQPEYVQSIPSDMRQVQLYGQADVVVTAHAGSMTNAQFMRPRSVLIEIGQYHKKVRQNLNPLFEGPLQAQPRCVSPGCLRTE